MLLGSYHMEKAERVMRSTIFDFIGVVQRPPIKSLFCAQIVRLDSPYSRGFNKILLSFS